MIDLPMNAVAVTGVGAVTPLGMDAMTSWQRLLNGESGIRRRVFDSAAGKAVPPFAAGELPSNPADLLSRVESRRLDRSQQSALAAAREAWEHAGATSVDPERLAVAIGTGIGGVTTLLDEDDVLEASGPRRVSPRTVPMLMPNGASAVVSIEFGARAGVFTPVSACSSGAEALAWGARLIRAGDADVVITGGSEAPISPITVSSFQQTRALARPANPASSSSRPFANDRTGFVLGEGAAIVVLESVQHAEARGAKILAVLAGAGIASDAHHVTAPRPDGGGQIRAMRMALRQANIAPGRVDHINAHATGTPLGDVAEARAIREVFGPTAVTAPKASTGHMFGAAGAIEAIFSILSLRDGVIPPTRNLTGTGIAAEIDLDIVTERRTAPQHAVVSNSFGFGGQNVSLAFIRP
ncbi:beta-ketoacyl-[acyl-carrier-protein] synthase family protein [Arthrobacter sp. NPDC080031]|uniref:beta-ketoacyl-[acyl-carrier-protein] synthase family protein n=1 Tax=Arthrobacter sp. NPDC080031 TaxID=3155918 RepID=UPI00344CD74F